MANNGNRDQTLPLRRSRVWIWLGVIGALLGLTILAVTFGFVPQFAPATNTHSESAVNPVTPRTANSAATAAPSQNRGDTLNPEALSRLGEISEYQSEPAAMSDSAPRSDFSIALWRLSRALDRFPQSKPQEVIRRANREASANTPVCPFEWNSGEPSLLLAKSSGVALGLASVLSSCASAVEQLH